MANRGNTVSVQAQDTDAAENESETETSFTGTEEESEQESSTVSGDDIPAPECTCKEKCSQYSVDKECEVCKENYSLCEYVNPNVKITINTPTGWHNDTTKVHILVEDVAKSGKVMEYRDFVEQVKEQIQDFLPEKFADAAVEVNQIVKNNDCVCSGPSDGKNRRK